MLTRIRKSVILRISLVILLSFLLMSFMFQEAPDWTDFGAVVGWLAFGGGAPIVVAYALSLLIENFPGWHNLPRGVKFIIPMLASVLLAVGANYILGFPEIIAGVSPIWFLIISAFLAWLGSQVAYMKSKAASYGSQGKET